jgi:hypothetical protein
MKKNLLFVLTGLLLLLCIVNCKHKIPEPGEPQATTGGSTTTGTTTTGNPNPGDTIRNKADSICFGEKIYPLLISNCAKSGCHNDSAARAGVVLIDYPRVISTISGNLLIQVIQDQGKLGMPPVGEKKLTPEQINLLKAWVVQGMKDGVDCFGPCDTANITYTGKIQPILQDNCLGCHNNTKPFMNTYDEVKAQISNGKFMCAINHGVGCQPMPRNANMLSPCKLRIIQKWVDAGAANN